MNSGEEQDSTPLGVADSRRTGKSSKEVLNPDRRKFLQLGILTAAGLLLPSCTKNNQPSAPSADISATKVKVEPTIMHVEQTVVETPAPPVEQPTETPVNQQETQKLPENISQAREFIAKLVPDEQYLNDTANKIIDISSNFSGASGEKNTVQVKYPGLSKDISITVQSGNSIYNILDTSPERGNTPESDSYNINITIDNDLGWKDIIYEEKMTLLYHELTHVAQYAHMLEFSNEFFVSDPDNLGKGAENVDPSGDNQEAMSRLLYLLYNLQISQARPQRSYEVVPYIVDNLYYYKLPEEVKSQFVVDRTSLYYPSFERIFADQVNQGTTVQDLINTNAYETFKTELTR